MPGPAAGYPSRGTTATRALEDAAGSCQLGQPGKASADRMNVRSAVPVARRGERRERVDRVRRPGPVDLAPVSANARCRRSPARPSRRGPRRAVIGAAGLCGGWPAGMNSDPLEPEDLARPPRRWPGGHVDRVERAAEDAERAGHDRCGPSLTRAPRARASHSSSTVPPIRTVSPATTPARRSSVSMPSRVEVALEALGRFLDRRSWSARRSARSARRGRGNAVGIELDREARRRHRLDPVDDDARRLGRGSASSAASGSSSATRARNSARPSPCAAEIAIGRRTIRCPGARGTPATPPRPPAGRPC